MFLIAIFLVYVILLNRKGKLVMCKTKEQISYNMSRIKSKDTKIEILLRNELWHRGLRYRKNVKSIVGKPDIAFIRKKIAVFCDSEFWHGYDWENRKQDFKSHQEFWIPKIEKNMQRDIEVTKSLESNDWIVMRFWGNDIKKNLKTCADKIENVWKVR